MVACRGASASMVITRTRNCLEAQLHARMEEPARAKGSLDALGRYTRKHVMAQHVAFKTARLRRALGGMLSAKYDSMTVPAGYRASLSVHVQPRGADDAASGESAPPSGGASDVIVDWDWALEGREIDFSVTFTADGASAKPLVVVPEARHVASDGPIEGRFVLPDGCTGVLRLEWSNYFSYLRQRVVNYRVGLPDGCSATPVTMA